MWSTVGQWCDREILQIYYCLALHLSEQSEVIYFTLVDRNL